MSKHTIEVTQQHEVEICDCCGDYIIYDDTVVSDHNVVVSRLPFSSEQKFCCDQGCESKRQLLLRSFNFIKPKLNKVTSNQN